MAVTATLDRFEAKLYLHLRPDEVRDRVGDVPAGVDDWAPVLFLWDGQKLMHGEWELLGVQALDLTRVTDEHLAQIERLGLPRVDVPEAGLADVSVADVIRWARSQPPARMRPAA